jgi:hypothetical protein
VTWLVSLIFIASRNSESQNVRESSSEVGSKGLGLVSQAEENAALEWRELKRGTMAFVTVRKELE